MGYTCVCGWSPSDGTSGYHLTTYDYKDVFAHEKSCDKYKSWWEQRQKENILPDVD